MRFLARLLGWLLGAVLTSIVIVAGFVYWRVQQGPIPLDFLTPRIEAAAHELDPNMEIDVGTTNLIWDGDRRQFELRAEPVKLGSGDQSVSIQSIAFGLETSALLHGELQLAYAELIGPSLRLVRDADGQFALGFEGKEGGGGVALPEGRKLHIDEIGIRDGDLVIEDRSGGLSWSLDHFDLELHPSEETVAGKAEADVDLTPVLGPAPANAPNSRTTHVRLEARYDIAADRLAVESLTAATADAVVLLRGDIAGVRGPSPQLSATATVAEFAVDSLATYWPATAAASARKWVTTNITGGKVTNVEVRLAATGGSSPALTTIEGQTNLEGVSVRYLDTMSPVTGVKGTAKLSAASADFAVTAGKVEDVAVKRAAVKIPIGGTPRIAIDAGVEGPLPTVMRILDQKPIELTKIIGLTARDGWITGNLGLAFPLRDGLRYDDLGLTASANATGVAIDRALGDLGASDTALVFGLKGNDLSLKADGKLAGIPASLDLRDKVGGRSTSAPQIAVKGEIDAAGWKTLGVETAGLVNGRTMVTASVVPERGGVLVDANADLNLTSLDLPSPLPDKPQDVPGGARAKLRFADGRLMSVAGFALEFTGNSLTGDASRTAAGWSSVRAQGTFAPPVAGGEVGQFLVAVDPGGKFKLTTADLGKLLRTLGYDNGRRGNLTFQGKVKLDERLLPFDGRLAVVDFTVTKSPLLARIFTVASFSGLMSMFTNEGIKFDRTSMQVTQRDGIVTIADGVARSSSVTFMSAGWLDIGNDRCDLTGRVIPSYFGINQGVAKIPVLGSLLTGKEAGAIQAITYTANGSLRDPKVSVNPLTSLTPQVLQDLWRKLEW